jgi:putative transposase
VYSRRIAGWNVASTLRADTLPLQALDMAAWAAGGDLAGLVHHAHHGKNYLSLIYTSRIAELGAQPSTGSVGDSYDAMAEAVNSLYKTELIRRRGPWRTVEQVELATMEWVWWWNNHPAPRRTRSPGPSRARGRLLRCPRAPGLAAASPEEP